MNMQVGTHKIIVLHRTTHLVLEDFLPTYLWKPHILWDKRTSNDASNAALY